MLKMEGESYLAGRVSPKVMLCTQQDPTCSVAACDVPNTAFVTFPPHPLAAAPLTADRPHLVTV